MLSVMEPKSVRGKVLFDRDEELDDVEASSADLDALVRATESYWDRYLALDAVGLGAMLAPDVTRMSQRTRQLQQGSRAVLAGLSAEWEAFERPDQRIAEEMTLRGMEISVDDERRASSAVIMYWVEVEGGALRRSGAGAASVGEV
jgi:hypothetical protein